MLRSKDQDKFPAKDIDLHRRRNSFDVGRNNQREIPLTWVIPNERSLNPDLWNIVLMGCGGVWVEITDEKLSCSGLSWSTTG